MVVARKIKDFEKKNDANKKTHNDCDDATCYMLHATYHRRIAARRPPSSTKTHPSICQSVFVLM
jgi:hypothetical protein